jgi:hypothetical protein
MVTRAGGSFAAVPAMVDASVKRGASEEKTRISNLMDAVMTASGGRTRISVLMDAVMKASEADDADVFSEECCISHVLSSDAKKNLERSKKKVYSEGSLVPNEKSIMAKVRVQQNCKAQEIQQQQQQQLIQSLCPPTFTKTVLAGSLAASHSSGIVRAFLHNRYLLYTQMFEPKMNELLSIEPNLYSLPTHKLHFWMSFKTIEGPWVLPVF